MNAHKQYTFSLVVISFFFSFTLHAYIFMGRMWHKKNQYQDDCYLVAIGDYHKVHIEERDQLYELMERIPHNALIIAENSFGEALEHVASWEKLYRLIAGLSYHAPLDAQTLSRIPLLAEDLEIECVNIEFRRHIHELFDLVTKLETNQVGKNVTFGDCAHIIQKYCHAAHIQLQALRFQPENIFADFHTDSKKMTQDALICLEKVANECLRSDIRKKTIDLDAFEKQIHREIGNTTLWKEFHDSHRFLLDSVLLKTLTQNQHRQVIFVCVGGAHISRIEPYIARLGYAPMEDKKVGDLANFASLNIKKFLNPEFPRLRTIKINRPHNLIEIKPQVCAQIIAGGALAAAYFAWKLYRA